MHRLRQGPECMRYENIYCTTKATREGMFCFLSLFGKSIFEFGSITNVMSSLLCFCFSGLLLRFPFFGSFLSSGSNLFGSVATGFSKQGSSVSLFPGNCRGSLGLSDFGGHHDLGER